MVESLSGESSNDTMLAIFARPRLMSLLQYTASGKLDGPKSLALLASRQPNQTTSLASYTGELERDILEAGIDLGMKFGPQRESSGA